MVVSRRAVGIDLAAPFSLIAIDIGIATAAQVRRVAHSAVDRREDATYSPALTDRRTLFGAK